MPFATASRSERPVAFVTGAGGDIGGAIAEEFGRRGWSVVLAARRAHTLEPIVASFVSRSVPHVELQFDVTDAEACASAITSSIEAFGRLDCLVNNAAAWFVERFLESTDEHWRTVMDVNLVAPARLARLAVPALRESAHGRIINISSKSAYSSEPGLGSYGVSKAALNALTMTMAAELGPMGIGVVGVAPGVIDTRSNDMLLGDPVSADAHRAQIPLGRFGTAEEVAKVVAFLGEEGAGFVTGSTLLMDGGQLARH